MECPTCGARLANQAAACERCGRQPATDAAAAPRRWAWQARPALLALGGLAGLLLVAVIAFAAAGYGPSFAFRQLRPTPEGALAACQQLVAGRLDAPESARFPTHGTESISRQSDGSLAIISSVDTEAATGAEQEVQFRCQVAWAGNGEWRLVRLDMDR